MPLHQRVFLNPLTHLDLTMNFHNPFLVYMYIWTSEIIHIYSNVQESSISHESRGGNLTQFNVYLFSIHLAAAIKNIAIWFSFPDLVIHIIEMYRTTAKMPFFHETSAQVVNMWEMFNLLPTVSINNEKAHWLLPSIRRINSPLKKTKRDVHHT